MQGLPPVHLAWREHSAHQVPPNSSLSVGDRLSVKKSNLYAQIQLDDVHFQE